MKNPSEEMEIAFSKQCKQAESYVEYLARKIMKNHPHLTEFVMAMGCASFITKGGDHVPVDERTPEFRYLDPLADFITEWDDRLGLTGVPMRFTATGTKITDW